MARVATTMLLTFALATSTLYGTWAQTPVAAPSLGPAGGPVTESGPAGLAPAPGPDCTQMVLGMADCLSYVQEGSNETKPDKACCPELKSLVDTSPVCLCELLANKNNSDFQIDYDRATKLPSVCKVGVGASACALLGIPVGSPTTSDGPAASPTALSPASGGSSGTSAASNKGDKAPTTAASVVGVLVGCAITSFF